MVLRYRSRQGFNDIVAGGYFFLLVAAILMLKFFPWFREWGRPGICIYAGLSVGWIIFFIHLIKTEGDTLKSIRKFEEKDASVVTKFAEIKAPKTDVFNFIADVGNWPRFFIHTIFSAKRIDVNLWEVQTRDGSAKIKMFAEKDKGRLDHAYIDSQGGRRDVTASLESMDDATVLFVLVLRKPILMSKEEFERYLGLVDEELQRLKNILER